MNDRIVRLAIAVVPFVGIVGTLVATLVDALVPGGDLGRDLLENSVLWMIGVQGVDDRLRSHVLRRARRRVDAPTIA